jgi:hypothetical protein
MPPNCSHPGSSPSPSGSCRRVLRIAFAVATCAGLAQNTDPASSARSASSDYVTDTGPNRIWVGGKGSGRTPS